MTRIERMHEQLHEEWLFGVRRIESVVTHPQNPLLVHPPHPP